MKLLGVIIADRFFGIRFTLNSIGKEDSSEFQNKTMNSVDLLIFTDEYLFFCRVLRLIERTVGKNRSMDNTIIKPMFLLNFIFILLT